MTVLLSGFAGDLMTASANIEYGRVEIILTEEGIAGNVVYIFRRDDNAVVTVRETADGTIQWPSPSTIQTVYDYEAPQGTLVDYIASDIDGNVVATVSLAVPKWGTWLKSPGIPQRNLRCFYLDEDSFSVPARREVYDIEGSSVPIVHSEPRSAGRTGVRLVVMTKEDKEAAKQLLKDGLPILIDTDPDFDCPFRYVSVGDYTIIRAFEPDKFSLKRPERILSLLDVVEVPAPEGGLAQIANWTYDSIPETFSSYNAIPAVVLTYEDLAIGNF